MTTIIATPNNTLRLSQYSAKAIVVHGDTKPVKDQLKELGGRFNFRLRDSNGNQFAGWIFPATKTDVIRSRFFGDGVTTATTASDFVPDPGEVAADNWAHNNL